MGRDELGRFIAGYSPDRGRGPTRRFRIDLTNWDLRNLVLEVANMIVSVPRGRGWARVTLFEALVLRLASGHVPRRAAVMDFIKLVFDSASQVPAAPVSPPSLKQHLATLREATMAAAATNAEQVARCIEDGFAQLCADDPK